MKCLEMDLTPDLRCFVALLDRTCEYTSHRDPLCLHPAIRIRSRICQVLRVGKGTLTVTVILQARSRRPKAEIGDTPRSCPAI